MSWTVDVQSLAPISDGWSRIQNSLWSSNAQMRLENLSTFRYETLWSYGKIFPDMSIFQLAIHVWLPQGSRNNHISINPGPISQTREVDKFCTTGHSSSTNRCASHCSLILTRNKKSFFWCNEWIWTDYDTFAGGPFHLKRVVSNSINIIYVPLAKCTMVIPLSLGIPYTWHIKPHSWG